MPLFLKRHYEWLAQELQRSKPATIRKDLGGMMSQIQEIKLQTEFATWRNLVEKIAKSLSDDNPRFNRAKFEAAILGPATEEELQGKSKIMEKTP